MKTKEGASLIRELQVRLKERLWFVRYFRLEEGFLGELWELGC